MIKIKNMEQLSTPADSWDWEGQTIMMIIIRKHIYIYIYIYIKEIKKKIISKLFMSQFGAMTN